MPTSSIMTGQALQRTLQTALSDVVRVSGECNFEYREGVQPPEAIGTVTSSGSRDSSPLFSSDALGPDLHVVPFEEVHFGILRACLACPPAKTLHQFTQFICEASLTRLSKQSYPLEVESSFLHPMAGLTCDVPFSSMELKASTCVGGRSGR
jgi:hypothetical protein